MIMESRRTFRFRELPVDATLAASPHPTPLKDALVKKPAESLGGFRL